MAMVVLAHGGLLVGVGCRRVEWQLRRVRRRRTPCRACREPGTATPVTVLRLWLFGGCQENNHASTYRCHDDFCFNEFEEPDIWRQLARVYLQECCICLSL
ncbi:hypothetical protein PVAP13_9NG301800 [Panicum virgatum]|uniref:Secreted protein n=1 Tax=Panicum virgatum TaxID=38727 RepID=A0A8T0MQ51_PANVG|nr:hypothetical protein PVAP13_9NG301800 [Panicum virgatum]